MTAAQRRRTTTTASRARQDRSADRPDPHDPQLLAIERAWLMLVRHAASPRLNERILRGAKLDLDRSAYPVLARLDENGPMRIRDIADNLDLDPSTVSRQLGPLERAGLVTRENDPSDSRAWVIDLTRSGRRALTKIREARHEMLADLLAEWSAEERHDLERLLTRLAEDAYASNRGVDNGRGSRRSLTA